VQLCCVFYREPGLGSSVFKDASSPTCRRPTLRGLTLVAQTDKQTSVSVRRHGTRAVTRRVDSQISNFYVHAAAYGLGAFMTAMNVDLDGFADVIDEVQLSMELYFYARELNRADHMQLGLAPPGVGLLPPGEDDVFAGRA